VVHVHPGPVGELLARELQAYAEFGHRFGTDAVLERLAAEVLAIGDADITDDEPEAGARRAGDAEGERPHLRVVRPSIT
jgi:hypothetical protein